MSPAGARPAPVQAAPTQPSSVQPSPPRGRFPLIAGLYVSQAIPLGFFVVAMPAILRAREVSLEAIGLLSAVAAPWLLKFLWAPLVDRFGSRRFGHHRSWLIPLQTLSVLCVALIAGLDPATQLGPLAAVGLLFMLVSATQDIATDGLAVRILPAAERGWGNGIQVGGYYLGQILGGGAVLVLYSRFGWGPALAAMALLLALPLLPVLTFREPDHRQDAATAPPVALDFRSIGRFFRRAGALWVVVVMLYRAGETMAMTMLNPMLVDLGYALDEIGVVTGVAGSLASMAGALTGGFWLGKLGRKRALVAFAAIQAPVLLLLILPATGRVGLAGIYAVVTAAAFAGGMATAALYTAMMDKSTTATAATDFTVQQALAAIGPLAGAGLSGLSATHLGYPGHFTLAATVSLLTALLIARRLRVDEPLGVAAPAQAS